MSRRLLKAVGSRGLYKTTHPEFGSWTSWEPLPPPADVDPAIKLLPEQAGPKEVAISLHGNPRDARRLAERADFALAAWGIRSRRESAQVGLIRYVDAEFLIRDQGIPIRH